MSHQHTNVDSRGGHVKTTGGPGRVADYVNAGGVTVARLCNFDIGRDWLKPELKLWLDQNVVGRLRNGGSVWIAGLTSTTGTEGVNLALSRRRAESVITFLRERLSKGFPFKMEDNIGAGWAGERSARQAGLADDVEDSYWRAVFIAVWDKPTPPPPPPPPAWISSSRPQECNRTVVRVDAIRGGGVTIYAYEGRDSIDTYLDGGGSGRIVFQDTHVRRSPGYCPTPFEHNLPPGAHPIVQAIRDDRDVVGEVVGYMLFRQPLTQIYADSAALARLTGLVPTGCQSGVQKRLSLVTGRLPIPLDALIHGHHQYVKSGEQLVKVEKVPLFAWNPGAGYSALSVDACSFGDPVVFRPSVDVVTDVYGQILADYGWHTGRNAADSKLRVGVKTVAGAGVKTVIKKGLKTLLGGVASKILIIIPTSSRDAN